MKTKGNLEYQEWRKVYGMNKDVGNYNRLSSSFKTMLCFLKQIILLSVIILHVFKIILKMFMYLQSREDKGD